MSSTYRSARRDLAIANEHNEGYLPCSYCGQQTEYETLSNYGARCGACFTLYCTGGKPNPPMPGADQRRAILQRMRDVLAIPKQPRARRAA